MSHLPMVPGRFLRRLLDAFDHIGESFRKHKSPHAMVRTGNAWVSWSTDPASTDRFVLLQRIPPILTGMRTAVTFPTASEEFEKHSESIISCNLAASCHIYLKLAQETTTSRYGPRDTTASCLRAYRHRLMHSRSTYDLRRTAVEGQG